MSRTSEFIRKNFEENDNIRDAGLVILAPEFQYPCSIEDINLVFTWVLNHAREYGMDEKNIFAVGDSAGAHNLGLYAAMAANPEYAFGRCREMRRQGM